MIPRLRQIAGTLISFVFSLFAFFFLFLFNPHYSEYWFQRSNNYKVSQYSWTQSYWFIWLYFAESFRIWYFKSPKQILFIDQQFMSIKCRILLFVLINHIRTALTRLRPLSSGLIWIYILCLNIFDMGITCV